MATHEELGSALIECLKDVSSLLEHAVATAILQKDALVKNDAATVASTNASQEEVMRRVSQADQRAAAVAAKIAEEAGLDSATADADAVAKAAGHPYTALIKHELARIPELAQRVRDNNEINSRLIANGLGVITSCLRLVAREPEPMVYSAHASYTQSNTWALSLNSRV